MFKVAAVRRAGLDPAKPDHGGAPAYADREPSGKCNNVVELLVKFLNGGQWGDRGCAGNMVNEGKKEDGRLHGDFIDPRPEIDGFAISGQKRFTDCLGAEERPFVA